MERKDTKPGFDMTYKPGYSTEYAATYTWKEYYGSRELNADIAKHAHSSYGDSTKKRSYNSEETDANASAANPGCCVVPKCDVRGHDPAVFASDEYPSVYREMQVLKDDRDRYIDPFRSLTVLPSGRRLMYDSTHPDSMYPSQWSSEVADIPGPYSYVTPVGFEAEIPWKKNLQWQVESEVGEWPTNKWKTWTMVASCPCYDGNSDQPQYAQYKTPPP